MSKAYLPCVFILTQPHLHFAWKNIKGDPTFRLFNETGQEEKLQAERTVSGKFYFDLSSFQDGVYFLLADEKPIRLIKKAGKHFLSIQCKFFEAMS